VRRSLRRLGAKGGKAAAGKGVRLRFERMTADERSQLAKKAARGSVGKRGGR